MVDGFEVSGMPFNLDNWGPSDTAATPSANLPQNVPFSRAKKLDRIADWNRNYNNPTRPKNTSDFVFDFKLHQLHGRIFHFGGFVNIRAHVCIGCQSVSEGVWKLKQVVHVVFGTPGRVSDMIKRGSLRP